METESRIRSRIRLTSFVALGQGGTRMIRPGKTKYWLFKTEPSTYSFAQLRAEGRTTWDGVKNPLALKHLANVATGDSVFIYHTGDEKAVVGVARAATRAYSDPKRKDAKLLVVDLTPLRSLGAPVSLAAIKASKRF